MNRQMLFSYNYDRIIITISRFNHFLHIRTQNRTLTNSMIFHKTSRTISRYIAIYQMFYLSQISNKYDRATCRYIYFDTILLRFFQRFNSTLRDAMCLKTYQSTIYIKNKALIFEFLSIFYPLSILYILFRCAKIAIFLKEKAKIA